MFNNIFDPKKFHDPISIDKWNFKTLKKVLYLMLLIRKTEIKLASEKKNLTIKGPVHLGVGQEAIAVGISQNLNKTDQVFGNHRSHSHLLAMNPDCRKLFSEILGKKSGFSKGMGGSMHLFDQYSGFYGSTPIVAGTVSLAVGAALASKMKKLSNIAVSYIGEGAIEEGIVHESFNLAKILNLPILFVIENNLFASHMHISSRQSSADTSRFAVANHIPYKLLDGNDVTNIAKNSKEMIENLRNNKGPGVLELITYRWYGHVDWREDFDVGVARSIEDINNWKLRDPIRRLTEAMIEAKMWTQSKNKDLIEDIDKKIKIAWEKAIKDPFQSKDSILKYVYNND